jgi:hypothetical protein
MGYNQASSTLSTVQQCVVNALAAGSTLTGAAETYGVHRVTVYRWVKNHKEFSAALRIARAEFVLASRDRLYHLSSRALDTLLAVLENPKSSPAVQLRTCMFVLQRPQLPKTGWSMPEPAPDPDGEKLLDSAIIEQDYNSLPGLYNIERDEPAEAPAEAEEAPAESVASETPAPAEPPPPPPPDVSGCSPMQHDLPNCEEPAPVPSGPAAPPFVLQCRPGMRHGMRRKVNTHVATRSAQPLSHRIRIRGSRLRVPICRAHPVFVSHVVLRPHAVQA